MVVVTTKDLLDQKYRLLGMVVGGYPTISDGFEKAQAKMIDAAGALDADAILKYPPLTASPLKWGILI